MSNQVLFWDFHGTLTHPDSLWSKSIHQAALLRFPNCGLKLDTVRRLQDNDGFPWRHPERDYRHLTHPEAWWVNISNMMLTTLVRVGFTRAEAQTILPDIRPLICDQSNFRLFPEVQSLLKDLQFAGWRHVILSNNFPELEALCEQLGIASLFDHIVVSALIGYEKPRREIFDYAMNLAGNPDVCYMIGDNPIADVDGAVEAGLPAILVNEPHGHGTAEHEPTYRCDKLDDLRPILIGDKLTNRPDPH